MIFGFFFSPCPHKLLEELNHSEVLLLRSCASALWWEDKMWFLQAPCAGEGLWLGAEWLFLIYGRKGGAALRMGYTSKSEIRGRAMLICLHCFPAKAPWEMSVSSSVLAAELEIRIEREALGAAGVLMWFGWCSQVLGVLSVDTCMLFLYVLTYS